MTHILDLVEAGRKANFHPGSPDDFFALQLAKRLNAPGAAGHYADLVNEHSRDTVLRIYERAVAENPPHDQLARHFHDLLAERPTIAAHYPTSRLIAIRVTRRSVAVAIFRDTHLDGVSLRHLANNSSKAESSAAAFIGTILAENRCETVAIEPPPNQSAKRRAIVYRAVTAQLTEAVAVYQTNMQAVLKTFANPRARSRSAVREIVSAIWPLGNKTDPAVLDAQALGLLVQTERLFAADDP